MKENEVLDKSDTAILILSCLQNVLMENGEPEVIALDESTPLIGPQSVLDSLKLVTLIVDLEQRLDEDYALSLILADERALSRKHSPFRTVASLSDYIHQLIEEVS